MEFLKFTLKGKTAFFKKPDVNDVLYYTYGNIHKVALLGIFGAILGYNGYNWQSFVNDKNNKLNLEKQKYPEFYEKLKEIKVGIIPFHYSFNKKKQSFNNSVGYASKEKGGNLIVKEIWLEKPSWDIYVAIRCLESEKLKFSMLNKKFVYVPYLGKNDHFADFLDIEVLNGEEINDFQNIDSLYKKNNLQLTVNTNNFFDLENFDNKIIYKYQEDLPISLDEELNLYVYENFAFTNKNVTKVSGTVSEYYNIGNKNIEIF